MPVCSHCGQLVPGDRQTVFIARDTDLANRHYLKDLRDAVYGEGIPRRLWRDAVADAVRDFEGTILRPDGTPWPVPEIDDVFPDDDDQKWISGFARPKTAALSGHETPRVQRRVLDRIRLLDLYFRIRHPELAAGFGARIPANDNFPPEER
jgi:hypothetical protein